MRRTVRTAAVTLASLLGAAGLAGAAAAAPVDVGVVQTAWFWQRLAPGVSPEPSNVPEGDLAVAANASGAATKASYVALDLQALPVAASINALSVTLTVDPAAQQLFASTPALIACRAAGVWTAGAATDWSAKPADDCTLPITGEYDTAAKTYRFDLQPYAAGWRSGGNRGFVLLPAPPTGGATAPFQIALLGRVTVVADITVPPAPVSSGGGSAGGSANGPVAAPAPVVGPAPFVPGPALGGAVTTPAVPVPAPNSAPRPAVATPPRRAVVRARAVVPLSTDGAPSAAFLLALLAGGAAVAGTAVLVAEDSLSPASAIARRRMLRAAAG